MKTGHDVRVVHQGADLIGECPTWNVDENALYWIDTRRPSIHRRDSDGNVKTWKMPTGMGAFAFRKSGGLIAGMQNGFCFIDLDQNRVEPIYDPEPDMPENRMNDGKCDEMGRFWIGSRDAEGKYPTASLYRLDPDLTCHKMDSGIIISNALAFSPKEPVLIYGDSTGETIFRYDYDAASGSISNKRIFLNTSHLPWRIDGANFDDEGYYWAALVRDGAIGRFDLGGRLDRLVRLPVGWPTMCCFGGPNLDIMYVTTASYFLNEEQRREQPLAGSLFAIHGLGVRGLPPARFGG
jgi:L-arabinonolactonase